MHHDLHHLTLPMLSCTLFIATLTGTGLDESVSGAVGPAGGGDKDAEQLLTHWRDESESGGDFKKLFRKEKYV